MFSDYGDHVLGVPDNPKLVSSDSGIDNDHRFRTPTLRNLRHTAPYMHSGPLATLDDVIRFYDEASHPLEEPACAGERARSGASRV